ncbi:MAG: GMC family oxidoreductase [Saprospiraceae bacterium]
MKKFDYIIIGAGSAGCVLANRLSADPNNKVLLVEAGGPDKNMFIHIPAGCAKLHKSEVDWGFETESQAHVSNRKIYLPRGKTLGGCSSTNYMAYVRGNKEDYNDWEKLGNKGWSYEEVLPYFKKSEHNEDITNDYHQQGGALNVGFSKLFSTPYGKIFIDACKEVGFEENKDYNGEKQAGVGAFQNTIKKGKRNSAVVAFLNPIKDRKNLTILTHTHTKKILIENGEATGIEVFNKKGATETYLADKEVIVSAGTFNSPQILMLSGIGNRAALAKHGINCVQELPGVGKNLQDHLMFGVGGSTKKQDAQNHHLKIRHRVLDLANYILFKKGALTQGPLECVAFGSTSLSPDRVDYQLHYASLNLGEHNEADIYDFTTYPTTDGVTILPTLLRPKSRGYVQLKSSDPKDKVLIQPNFLSAPEDRQVLIEAGRKAIQILKNKRFTEVLEKLYEGTSLASDEDFLKYIQDNLETVYHPVGTCKMGQDNQAVVDERLRVHGVNKLRVIDASIMPTIVSGNTNAPTMMIGEKGAAMILADAQLVNQQANLLESLNTLQLTQKERVKLKKDGTIEEN